MFDANMSYVVEDQAKIESKTCLKTLKETRMCMQNSGLISSKVQTRNVMSKICHPDQPNQIKGYIWPEFVLIRNYNILVV